MSWQATTWALEQKVGSPARKLVLICLANYADKSGRCVITAQTVIADDTEMGERTVRDHLASLEASGFISREKRGEDESGKFLCDEIVLNMNQRQILPVERTRAVEKSVSDDHRQISPSAESAGGTEKNQSLSNHRQISPSAESAGITKSLINPLYAGARGADEKSPTTLSDPLRTLIPEDWKPDGPTLARLVLAGCAAATDDEVRTFVAHHLGEGTIAAPGQWGWKFVKWSLKGKAYARSDGGSSGMRKPYGPKPVSRMTDEEVAAEAKRLGVQTYGRSWKELRHFVQVAVDKETDTRARAVK